MMKTTHLIIWTVVVLIIFLGAILLHASIFPVKPTSLNETTPSIPNSTMSIDERFAAIETYARDLAEVNAENIKTISDRQYDFSKELRMQTYSLVTVMGIAAGLIVSTLLAMFKIIWDLRRAIDKLTGNT